MVSFSSYPADPRPRRAAEALLKEGMSVDFLCLEDEGAPTRERFGMLDIRRLPVRHRRGGKLAYAYQYSAFILAVAGILALRSFKRRYHLVYIHNMPDVLVFSSLVPKLLGAKVILDQHDPMPELMTTIFGLDEQSFGVRLMRWLEKLSIGWANAVVTVNIACKRIFAARSCRAEKIGVVMNAPDGSIFPFQAPRERRPGRFVIMYHGSIVERNGLDLAIEALARVRHNLPGVELRVYGRQTAFLDQVMEEVRQKGLADCVHYLGPRRLDDLVGEIADCDLGIIPNQRNAFTYINTPTRIFEYLALGKPVIAPRTPGIEDYFGAHSLIFFESGNADQLGAQIEHVFRHPEDALATAHRGQEVYLSHTWTAERETLVNLVSGVLNGERALVTPTDFVAGPAASGLDGNPEVVIALDRLETWVEAQNYRGYEPFDGLSSWARVFAFHNQLAERILQQTIRQCPINLRPLFGVNRKDSTKGRGYMAWGYLRLYRTTGRKEYLDKATACLEWLDTHKVARFRHHSWSNHFDFVSRGGSYTKDDPIIVWTSLIGHAYLEAFEITGKQWFLDVAASACNWIMELPRERTERGECISYLAHAQSSIHNANMLGAGLLARTAKHTGDREYRRTARSAMEYSCSRQLPDGSWWYAEAAKFHWIDNFHTGYNLDSLDTYIEATGDGQYRGHLEKGLAYYKANFFEDTGRPKYYHTRTYPVDIQCAAQSIDTLARFAQRDPECRELVRKAAAWTIRNMQDRKGYFYYRQYPLMKAKTPMLHWGQATMFKALAELLWQSSCPA